jgi:hypothetical protein
VALPYKRFIGKLNGKNIKFFTKQLDYSIKDQQKRIERVKDVLYTKDGYIDKFFEEYMDDYYKKHPNKEDYLSQDIEVFKELEKMANYILFCPGAERITKKTKYNFYTDDKFKEKLRKDIHLDGIISSVNNNIDDSGNNTDIDALNGDEVIAYLIRKGENYKKQIKQKIFKKDFKDKELKCLIDYQNSIDSMREKLGSLRKNGENIWLQKKLVSNMGSSKDDELMCKDKIKRTIYFKQVLPDEGFIDYDMFDFFDKEQVKALLRCTPRDFTADLGILIYDMEQLVQNCGLTIVERNILDIYRQSTYDDENTTLEGMANKLGVKQQYISAVLNNICNKIISKFEEVYEDWYYLNKVKGKYKKCSSCGKIKLANERYFRKRSDNKGDGYYNQCRICEKANKSDEKLL